MNQLSEEQQGRLKQIRERIAACDAGASYGYHHLDLFSDLRFTLSLLDSDSQAVGHGAKEIVDQFEALRTSSSLIDVEVSYGYLTQAISTLQTRAATAMRDKCVDKVRTKAQFFYSQGLDRTASVLVETAQELESLTLDQVKPGEM